MEKQETKNADREKNFLTGDTLLGAAERLSKGYQYVPIRLEERHDHRGWCAGHVWSSLAIVGTRSEEARPAI